MKRKRIIGRIIIIGVVLGFIFYNLYNGDSLIPFQRGKIKVFSKLEYEVVYGGKDSFELNWLGVKVKNSSKEKVIGVYRRCKSSFSGMCDTSKEGPVPLKGKTTKFEKTE